MVSVAEGNDVEIAGVFSGHHHCHIVSFGAAIDKVDALQRFWQSRGQPLCILMDLWMHINAGCVPKGVHLGLQGCVDLLKG